MIKKNISFILPLLLIVFIILSNLDINFYGEYSLLEFLQIFLISSCIFLHLKYRTLLIRKGNILTLLLRLLIFTFLIYEELSFLTEGTNNFFNTINHQSEINFHNLKFIIIDPLFEISIKSLNYSALITGYFLLGTIFLFILGYGSYLPFLRNFRFLFLERQYAIYSWIFIINVSLSSILKKIINPSLTFINSEFCELFIYLIFFIDTLHKIQILRSRTD